MMDGTVRDDPETEPHRESCEGCGDWWTRRRVVGRISAAMVAAMAGVTLSPGTAEALPLVEATGAPTGPDERSFPLPAADRVTIDRDAQVIVVRFQQKAYVFNLACPHENTALRWRQRDLRFQCPRHESQYQPDGTFVSGRATRNMDRFAVKRAADNLVVDLNRLFRSDQQPQDWAAAAVPV
jgi:nitrite reductase/ring-hydroxylating ferredoxin subunit